MVYIISSYEIPKNCAPIKGKFEKAQPYGKPTCVKLYNKCKQGVDHCNARCVKYRYNHPLYKWWKVVYFHLTQLTLSNAYVIYDELDKMERKGRSKRERNKHGCLSGLGYFLFNIINKWIKLEEIEKQYMIKDKNN